MASSLSADLRELYRLSMPACTVVLGAAMFHGGRALTHGDWPVLAIDLAVVAVTAMCIALYVRRLNNDRARRAIGGTVAITALLTAIVCAVTAHILIPGLFSLPLAVVSVVLMVATAVAVFRLMYVLAIEGD